MTDKKETEKIENLGNRDPLNFPEEGKILTGVVKKFFELKGYGFVLDSDNNEYFVHYKEIQCSGYRNLARGQHVKFVGKSGPKGLFAEKVELVNL